MTLLRAMGPLRRPGAGVAGRSRLSGMLRLGLGLVPITVLVFLYQQLAVSKSRPRIFPQVGDVWDAFYEILIGHGELGSSYDQIMVTSLRIVSAFAISFVIGIVIGVAAGRNKLVFSFVENLVWVFMAVPSVVWVYIMIVGLGLNPVVPPLAVAATVMPQFIVLVAEGAKSVPDDLVEMARSYKTSTWQRFTELFLPYLVPYIIAASRTSFATAVKIMLVAEVIGTPSGIGFEVSYWDGKLFMGPVIAWGITMLLMGLLVDNFIFSPIERRVSGWKSKPIDAAETMGAVI